MAWLAGKVEIERNSKMHGHAKPGYANKRQPRRVHVGHEIAGLQQAVRA